MFAHHERVIDNDPERHDQRVHPNNANAKTIHHANQQAGKKSYKDRRRDAPAVQVIEELEPRVLLSADAAGFLAPDFHDPQQPPSELVLDQRLEIAPSQNVVQEEGRRFEIVFVDSGVPDADELVEVTPESIRLRKKILTEGDRRRDNTNSSCAQCVRIVLDRAQRLYFFKTESFGQSLVDALLC